MILSILLSLIFIGLGGIHFFWVLGGKWGLQSALPTKVVEQKVIEPPKIATLIVGLVLMAFGYLYIIQSGLIAHTFPDKLVTYGLWVIPCLFIIRAIGEFNYVGFFKRVKHTDFGKMDTKLFSPLCLFIGLVGLIIQLLK